MTIEKWIGMQETSHRHAPEPLVCYDVGAFHPQLVPSDLHDGIFETTALVQR